MNWLGIAWAGIKAVAFGGGDSNKAANNIERAASFIGRQYDVNKYTEQERAEANNVQIANFGEWFKLTINENTERSITRRLIALLIIRLGVGMTIFSIATYKYDIEWSRFTFEWFKVWWPIFAAVGFFFFGTHLMRSWPTKGEK